MGCHVWRDPLGIVCADRRRAGNTKKPAGQAPAAVY